MAKLTYTGPSIDEAGGVLPLPEGWPGHDHDEPDEDLAAEKVASGKYELAEPPAKPKAAKAGKEDSDNG